MSAEAGVAQAELRHPEIVEVTRSGEQAALRLVIPEALLYFRGHFPGFAILPGVVQLDWAIGYCREYFALGSASAATLQIKFRQPIRPNHRVTLRLKHSPARNRVEFDYSDADGACSSGHISFTAA
ncbi:MAG: thioester dehydrase [Candidatus Binataceae bacterium]